jgi:hypothetical protein
MLVILAVTAGESAALTPIDHEARASVRIGAGGGCSGVIIVAGPETAYGVSAAHCVSAVNSQFTIGFVDGRQANARWLAVDRQADLALFSCWSRDVLGVSAVRDGIPDGEFWARAVGFPSGQGPNVKDLQVVGGATIEGGMQRNEFRVESGTALPGDSGGGVFIDGKLIGVTSHESTDRSGPNQSASRLYASQNQQLVAFIRSYEPRMAASCRDNWCWTPQPNRPIDTTPRPLPDLDSDRDRQQALQSVLDRLDGIDRQISDLHDQSATANSAIADLQRRLDRIEESTKQIEPLAATQAEHTASLNQIASVLDRLATADESIRKANDAQDASLIKLGSELDAVRALANRSITVEILDRSGKVIDRETYKAGEPIRLQFGQE